MLHRRIFPLEKQVLMDREETQAMALERGRWLVTALQAYRRCLEAGTHASADQRVVFRVRPLGRGVQGDFSQPSDSVWTSVPDFDDGSAGAEPVVLCSAAEMQAMLGKARAEAGRLRDEMEAQCRRADELRAKHDAAVNDAVRLSDQLRAERVVTTELHGTVAELRMELKQAPRRRGRGVDDELLDLT